MSGSVGAIRIINTFGPQTVTDVGTLSPFSGVTISDPNGLQTETLTVTLSDATNGKLTNLGGGTYNAVTGVYTDTGSAAAVTADLDALIFTPTWHQVAPGATVATTLTVTNTDTAGANATDSATTITATGTNSPLPIGPIYGIDYGPSPASGGPYPSAAQINTDMSYISEMANTIRLYTVSNGMSYAVTSAIAHGLRVVPSAYLVDPSTPAGAAANNAEIANLISVLNNPATDLTKIPFVDVGSDFLASSPTQAAYLISEIQYVKAHIPSGVMVTTSESIANYTSNPTLASAVDLIFPTISPYALGGIVSVNNASQLALIQYQNLVTAFPTQNVVISEIGWPSSGTTGSVVGSVANEEAFWTQFILTAAQLHINYFGFQAFDSQNNTNTGFSGPNWGLYTASGTPKGTVITLRPTPPLLIVGTVGGQQTTDAVPISPFSGVTITESTAGQTETVTVTISVAANGSLSNLGGGSYNAGTGVYTVSGTATGVTTALDGLIFVPTQHLVPFGQTFVTTFTITDSDTAGVALTDATTTVTATAVVIESAGGTSSLKTGNQYSMLPTAGGTSTVLKYNGAAVTVGQFGATVNPIGAETTATGFEVAWKISGAINQYIVWYTDTNGNYLSSPTGVVSGTGPALENIEVSFHQDLNGDGTVGLAPTVIESYAVTTLGQVGNEYAMLPTGANMGTVLKYNGAAVTVGQFGATVNPIGAETTATGFEVAWKISGATNQYIVWYTDANGNYLSSPTGVVSGIDPALENIEGSFHQDLNGDGTIGLARAMIESSAVTPLDTGVTSLDLVGNRYSMLPTAGGTSTVLKYNGAAVTVGQFGATVNPIGAEATATGFEVAWKISGATNQYIVWYTDANGNYLSSPTGVVSGTGPALENIEVSFHQDLNGDGTVGLAPTVIESSAATPLDTGATTLGQIGNEYAMLPTGGNMGAVLKYNGAAVTVGEFGATVNPIGAETTATGFAVAWKISGTINQYIVWYTDANGTYLSSPTGVMSGTDPALENIEVSFHQDLNGDGTVGLAPTVIESSAVTPLDTGATTLGQVGNEYAMLPTGGNMGTVLKYNGAAVTVGEFGATVNPIGAEATATGFEVAWKISGTINQYIIWYTDANGIYLSSPTGVVSGTDPALENIETTFNQDLNGDGTVGVPSSSVYGSSSIVYGSWSTLVPNVTITPQDIGPSSNTALASAGLSAPTLNFIGSPNAYTLEFHPTSILYDLAPSSGIETVANFILGLDNLTVFADSMANSTLRAFDTSVGGNHAIALASSTDLSHGIVLLNMATTETAADLLANHTTFSGGYAYIH